MTAPAFFVALDTARGLACRVLGSEVDVREFEWPDLAPTASGGDVPGDAADAAAGALGTLGYDGRGIALGLGSDRVYAARIASDGLPRKGRRAALLYRLEEHLPLDAENLTADFLPASGGRTLGVAVETGATRQVLDRLAAVGVQVEAVCPTALLTLWQVMEGLQEKADFFLLGAPDHADVFRVSDGGPLSWYSVPCDPREVSRAVHADLLIHPAQAGSAVDLVSGPLPPEFLDAVAAETGLACRRVTEEPSAVLAARAAPALLSGAGAGWVNLRRDRLGAADRWDRLRRPVRTVAVLAIALLATVIGGAWWRAERYDAEADRLIREQRAVFAHLYPNREVPAGVRRWLASEATRLAALSGAGEATPRPSGALETLRKVASGLPQDLRFRVVMVRVEPTEVFLEGQARSHADAETVARGIAGQGITMEAPRTESLAKGGVAFTLVGQPAAPKTVPGPGGTGP